MEKSVRGTKSLKQRARTRIEANSDIHFCNEASNSSFIGRRNLTEVIDQDKSQLRKIGGSFAKMANRMDSLLKKAEQARENRMVERKNIFIRHGYNTEEMFDVPGREGDLTTPLGLIMKDVEELFKRPLQLKNDPNLEVIKIISTRGQQDCPFDNCNENIYGGKKNGDYLFRNKSSGKEVFINLLTTHLARKHSLLEKDNEYGISAEEFYKEFM